MNSTSVEFFFADNGARIKVFQQTWDAIRQQNDVQIQDVLITGSASPEGSKVQNQRLSEERARHLGSYLAPVLGVEENTIRFEIREPAPKTADPQKWSEYRSASARVLVVVTKPAAEEEASPEPEVTVPAPEKPLLLPEETQPAIESEILQESAQTEEPTPKPSREWMIAPRTNLLLPALNVGLEVPIGNRWSVGADWYFPWLWRPQHSQGVDYAGWCVEALALSLEGRYWLGNRTRENRLLGHSIGVMFTMAGYYDFEWNYKGIQGEFATIGLDYMYALGLKNGWHMEFSLGVGYFYSQGRGYEVYTQGGKGYKEKDMAKVIQWFGPVKATVSLVIPITFGKKGGEE